VSHESTTPNLIPPTEPREDVLRGALVALVVVPLGVAAWLLVWSLGFIASIVAFGVAIAALWLYRLGARGPISRAGAFVVTGITALTLVLAFFAGIVLDAVRVVADETGLGWGEILTRSEFWSWFGEVLPPALGDYTGDILLALLFGALGCFTVLRSAFRQAKPVPPADAPAFVSPSTESGVPAVPAADATAGAAPEAAAPSTQPPAASGGDEPRAGETPGTA